MVNANSLVFIKSRITDATKKKKKLHDRGKSLSK